MTDLVVVASVSKFFTLTGHVGGDVRR